MPGNILYLNVPKAKTNWSPLAAAKECPTKAFAAVIGQSLMANAFATRSKILDSVTLFAGVLDPWACIKLCPHTADSPTIETADATALAKDT